MVIPASIVISILTAFLIGLHREDFGLALRNLSVFISDISLEGDVLEVALWALYETLVISIFATSAAVPTAFLLAAASAGGIAPQWAAAAARSAASFARSIPALLWGVVGVVMFGPGPAAGGIALWIYSAGYLAKLFYETFENVDRDFVDSMKAMGARGLTLARLMYLKERRQFVTNVVFIFEYNVRTASIIGFVGAGGIGYYIAQYLGLLQYGAALTVVLVTFLFVLALEAASYYVRRRLV